MDRIKELVEILNNASESYYNGREVMSNAEWDGLFDELKELEAESGIVLDESPTVKVGAVPEIGTKVTHRFAAKSLDKTKDVDLMASKMAGEDEVLVMWKLDGGTLQLTYDGGRLLVAATRGNGQVGQDITANAPAIKGIPMEIEYKGPLTLRGEALMSYGDFERINADLPEESQYANPRNLANATVSMLDINEVKKRSIHFKVFGIVDSGDLVIEKFDKRMEWLSGEGFDPVEWEVTTPGNLRDTIGNWSERVAEYSYPVDGLVVASNDIYRCEQLPGTSHHPNILAGFAFKWADTLAETILREIEWSPSRTGLINPVAIFDGVELEGTSVSRASLHNFSYVREKHLRVGDPITVYKANMIIPQVQDNLSENDSGFSEEEVLDMIPNCPACGRKAVLREANGIETIHCENENCSAKGIGKFVLFCSRNAMDIEGLSEATLTRFVEMGFLHNLGDIYRIKEHKEKIVNMEGFGEKSFENIVTAIENSRTRDIVAFVTALGIPGIGRGQARLIAEYFKGNAKLILDIIFGKGPEIFDYTQIDGMGEVLNEALHGFAISSGEEGSFLGDLLSHVEPADIEMADTSESAIGGKTFVITGNVEHFANRNELKEFILERGGKVTGSVTGKTDYLINNDVTSTSGKNKKAVELGIPVISEEDFLKLVGESMLTIDTL